MLWVLVVFLALVVNVHADYTAGDDVVELTKKNFKQVVKQSDDVWLVQFYAPW